MRCLLTLLLVALVGCTTTDLPEGCVDPPGNNMLANSIASAIESLRPVLENGSPDLGIPPLDPFGPLPKIEFGIDMSSLRMDGAVNDTMIANISKYLVCKVTVSIGISQKFEMDLRFDNLHLQGLYEVDGMIMGLFPVFGSGHYTMDINDAGMSGGAKLVYNPFQDEAYIKDLALDIFFDTLDLKFECILGCGDMSDLINGVISDIAPAIFDAVWNSVQPYLTTAIEDGINDLLKNISISDLIPMEDVEEGVEPMELGNANEIVDGVMGIVGEAIVAADLDPAPLPGTGIDLGLGYAELYDGHLSGLSDLHRDGTCTWDLVAAWLFLYANLGVQDLHVQYSANVTSGSLSSLATLEGTVSKASVYMVARQDLFGFVTDIDQFVITEFGYINMNVEGLHGLGFLLEPLIEGVINLVRESLANLLETEVKDIIQDVLGEQPWPMF